MRLIRFIFFPFGIIYWLITTIRNGFYQLKIFKASRFSIPIINVGNLSMGGTGKTPHTEYLIRLLKTEYKLVTLSRGFGRKERGFILAKEGTNANQIGDEPLQYFTKFGEEINVAVDANRVTGVMDICRALPETNLILLDDAFQHRAISAGLNILITTYENPFFNDFILPVGNLRESRTGSRRADLIIVSKCPDFELIDKEKYVKRINPNKGQHVFFSKINYGNVFSLNNFKAILLPNSSKVILVTGIAKSDLLKNELEKNNTILHHFNFNDHYNFKEKDLDEIHNLFGKFASENPVIMTTEKDAMRLLNEKFQKQIEQFPWFFQSIEIEIDKEETFNKIVKGYVEKNS